MFNHLRKRGVELRGKVEAQLEAVTKHKKSSFLGSQAELAYLLGIRCGDFYVVRHGRAVRVKLTTTHPAMADLFLTLFKRYGPVYRYPKEGGLVGAEWCLDADLDESFDFLLEKDPLRSRAIGDNGLFLNFLAGFLDAEGSIYLHMKRGRPAPEISLSNTNRDWLQFICGRLSSMGYHAKLQHIVQQPTRAGIAGTGEIDRVKIWRFHDVQRLLSRLHLKHAEKVAKAMLVLQLQYREKGDVLGDFIGKWRELVTLIKLERDRFVEEARKALDHSDSGAPRSTH